MGRLSTLRSSSFLSIIYLVFINLTLFSCDTPRYPEDDPGFWTYGEWPDHAPSQDSILFVKDETIYVVGFNDPTPTALVTLASHPNYHPEGRGFAYEKDSTIYLKFFGIETHLFLTKGLHPAWSQDGSKLAFYLPRELRNLETVVDPQVCIEDYCIQYLDLSQNKLTSVSLNQTLDGYGDSSELPTYFAWGPGDSILFFASEHFLGWVNIESEMVEMIESTNAYSEFMGPLNWSEKNELLLIGKNNSTLGYDRDLEEQRSWSRTNHADWTHDESGIVYVVYGHDYIFEKSFNWE
jgi:hypothetical protein